MQLTSPAFKEGETIPKKFTCEGQNISPEISWQGPPKEAKSFVLILHDPDAPGANGFTHWLLYDIPAGNTVIHENIPTDGKIPGVGVQGANDSSEIGYTGPCPPSGTHRYFFRLYALRKVLGLQEGASAREVQTAMDGHIIEQTELMGTFAKARAKGA